MEGGLFLEELPVWHCSFGMDLWVVFQGGEYEHVVMVVHQIVEKVDLGYIDYLEKG